MPEELIQTTCTGCSSKLKVKMNAAGKQLSCPKCKATVHVPHPGKEWLRKKCCECGTEHDFEHNAVCETCHAPASEQSTWCTLHRNVISSTTCANCVALYHAIPAPTKTTAPSEKSAFPPSMYPERTIVRPVSRTVSSPAPVTATEPTVEAIKPVNVINPVEYSRSPLWSGIVAVASLFCCPCISSFIGLGAIVIAFDSQQKIAKADQVGMVQRKIIAGYVCGGVVIFIDGLRTLVFVAQYFFS